VEKAGFHADLGPRWFCTRSQRDRPFRYTGGKTGKRYTFAVGYFPWDSGDVLVSSSASWPKTIGNAHDVRLLIKGQWYSQADRDR
jgi:hypothetical protein